MNHKNTLDEGSSALASDLLSEYDLGITSLGAGSWLFSITPRSASSNASTVSPYSVPCSASFLSNRESIPSHFALISRESIPCHPELVSGSPDSSTVVTLHSSVSSRKIVTVSYTTSSSLPIGEHTVKISDLSAIFSDGTSLHQSEILVPITTVSTSTLLLPEPIVIVSLTSDILTVTNPSSESVTVYSLSGTLLYRTSKDQGSTVINVGHLPRGVLIVRGSSGWVRKVFKQ